MGFGITPVFFTNLILELGVDHGNVWASFFICKRRLPPLHEIMLVKHKLSIVPHAHIHTLSSCKQLESREYIPTAPSLLLSTLITCSYYYYFSCNKNHWLEINIQPSQVNQSLRFLFFFCFCFFLQKYCDFKVSSSLLDPRFCETPDREVSATLAQVLS